MENVNIEELKKALRETEEKIQNEFIDSLFDKVQFLLERSEKPSYQPTAHERETVAKIAEIINSIKW